MSLSNEIKMLMISIGLASSLDKEEKKDLKMLAEIINKNI